MSAPELRNAAAPPPRVDALVCRLAGALALMAGAIFLVCAIAITRLPWAAGPNGASAYAIPGTPHALEPAVVPLLGSIGLIAAAIGLLAIAVGRLPSAMIEGAGSVRWPRRPSFRRQGLILLFGVVVLAVVLWFKA